MSHDPITGPMPRSHLKDLVDAPHGKAAEHIRKYDPQWGLAPGEKFEWKVEVERDGADHGTAYIMAASQKEADELADNLTEEDVDWGYDDSGFSVLSVEPHDPMKSR